MLDKRFADSNPVHRKTVHRHVRKSPPPPKIMGYTHPPSMRGYIVGAMRADGYQYIYLLNYGVYVFSGYTRNLTHTTFAWETEGKIVGIVERPTLDNTHKPMR